MFDGPAAEEEERPALLLLALLEGKYCIGWREEDEGWGSETGGVPERMRFSVDCWLYWVLGAPRDPDGPPGCCSGSGGEKSSAENKAYRLLTIVTLRLLAWRSLAVVAPK